MSAFIITFTEVALWAALISTGLMAGIYFTFSVFVMSSLNQIAANQAIEAMNSINRVILKSGFMPLFFGSCIVALGLIGLSLAYDLSNGFIVVSLIYLIGMFGITLFFNVPLNNALQDAQEEHAQQDWDAYYMKWLNWNHMRTISSTIAFIGYVFLLSQLPVS